MRRVQTVLMVSALIFAAGCGSKNEDGASSAEANGSAAAASSASASHEATTKLTLKQIKEAYDKIDALSNNDPWDKKKADYIAALGAPAKTPGEWLVWYQE